MNQNKYIVDMAIVLQNRWNINRDKVKKNKGYLATI